MFPSYFIQLLSSQSRNLWDYRNLVSLLQESNTRSPGFIIILVPLTPSDGRIEYFRESIPRNRRVHCGIDSFMKTKELMNTEAAAATAVLLFPGSSPIFHPPKQFKFDHPFALTITDTTGSIIFVGRVRKME
uniref:Serpin domain-containing protein n=1 Tax=Cacopsylla melanoneura TaxID=428564 RepID=A0A8D8ZVU6_9HEMI